MLNRLRARRGDEGFTLIELLVVIIIIGILAAIAIPVFLNQRQKGWDAAVKSDLKNAATAQETVFTETGNYTNALGDLTDAGFKQSPASNFHPLYDVATHFDNYVLFEGDGVTPTVVLADATGGFCMDAISASGKTFKYDSVNGGLIDDGTAC